MGYKIIAFGGQKGGVGKSTIVASLALALGDTGMQVHLVDADEQGTLSTWFTAHAAQTPDTALTLEQVDGEELRPALMRLRQADQTGVVLVDLQGHNSKAQRAAMTVADLFVIPVRSGPPDIWALGATLPLIEDAKQFNPNLKVRLVLNAMDKTAIARDVRASLRDVAVEVFDTELGYRVDYRESIGAGIGPTLYKPNDKAAQEIRALRREIRELLAI